MMRPKIDVPLEKRRLADPLGNNFRATYTTVKDPGTISTIKAAGQSPRHF